MKKICAKIIVLFVVIGICAGGAVFAAGNDENEHSTAKLYTPNENVSEDEINGVESGENTIGVMTNSTSASNSTTPRIVEKTSSGNEVTNESKNKGLSNHDVGLIAAAIATGLGCIGAGIAVAMVASSAIGAISENPALLGKTIIFAGLAEGIAIYGLIISIMILNKI